MKFKTIIRQKAFWKSVFWLGFFFLLVYNFGVMFFETGGIHPSEFIESKIEEAGIVRFLLAQFIGGFCYGFILAFGQFHLNQKKR